jgi:hypothetical protein
LRLIAQIGLTGKKKVPKLGAYLERLIEIGRNPFCAVIVRSSTLAHALKALALP